jgi:hypothetical protein
LTERSGIPHDHKSQAGKGDPTDAGAAVEGDKGAPVATLSLEASRNNIQRLHLDPIEPIEYSVGGDPREGTSLSLS